MSIKGATLPALSFGELVGVIRQVHDKLAAQAGRAVNTSLTMRNWLIGFHVEEYERRGVDRAEYGDKLMDRLSESLTKHGVSRCDRREIYRYRQFYLTYPQIVEAVTPQLEPLVAEMVLADIRLLPDAAVTQIVEAAPQFRIDGKTLISSLSLKQGALKIENVGLNLKVETGNGKVKT
ncbi:MAG: hypothetical protein KJ826_00365 [Proteobacteria bacterium]|nr:hypothetical protein [Pseudomonadota bacterium]